MSSGHLQPTQYYIALQDIPLSKDGSSIWKKAKDAVIGSGSGYVFKGELLLGDGHSESGMFIGSLASDPSKRVVCPMLYVSNVTNSEYKLIAPVKELGDRLVLFNNKEKLHSIKKLQVNSHVWVSVPAIASRSTCRYGTIKYIGPIEGEEGHHFGIELKVAVGTCDGTFRRKRYFACKDNYGIFVTAFNLNITSRAQAITMEKKSVILSSDKSQTGRTFYEDDKVAVYSTGGKRVTGRARWAYPVLDKDQQKYNVIGIETDKPNITHSKIEGYHSNMGHLFNLLKDYAKHSYIAVPEVSVLKDEEDQHGTPVDVQDPQLRSYDLIPKYPTNEQGLSQSILTTATKVAESERVSKCELISENHQLETAHKEKLAEAFGLPPEELAAQEQAYKLLQKEKEEKDRIRREMLHGGVGNLPACSTHNPDRDPGGEQFFDATVEPRRKSNNDFLEPTQHVRQSDFRRQQSESSSPELSRYPDGDPRGEQFFDAAAEHRRKSNNDLLEPTQHVRQSDFHRQQSESSSPKLSRKNPPQENPPTYPFDIGSIVEVNLNDKTVSGTVRWLGYLPKTPKVIAGVELDERLPDCGDGNWDGKKHFDCEKGYGMFILADKVKLHPHHGDVPKGRNGNLSVNLDVEDLKAKTQQLLHSHEKLTEEHRQLSSAHQQLQDNHQQLTGYCQQLTKNHRQLSEDHHQLSEDHRQLSEDHRQLSENHKQLLDTVEENVQNISELKKVVQAMQPSWSITPSELRMTEERIGGGGWGEVKVGYYHGTKVAVKEMYDVIVSDYNRETFQREMRIASLVRHPNLLLFVGAVTIGNLQIVTEVMEISLRELMKNGRLTPKDISPVAKDVACALNYLHTRPDPIIHRDVSSANVLLNSKQGGWVAKLGDFGSANFLTKTNTQVPGALIYSAPEARDSSVGPQGPKMDTYSYGVLLLEMCVCRLPDPQVIRSAVGEVSKWSQPKRSIGELAIQCMRQDPDQRPYMATVVRQL